MLSVSGSRSGRRRRYRHFQIGRSSASCRKSRCSSTLSVRPSTGEAGSRAGRGPRACRHRQGPPRRVRRDPPGRDPLGLHRRARTCASGRDDETFGSCGSVPHTGTRVNQWIALLFDDAKHADLQSDPPVDAIELLDLLRVAVFEYLVNIEKARTPETRRMQRRGAYGSIWRGAGHRVSCSCQARCGC